MNVCNILWINLNIREIKYKLIFIETRIYIIIIIFKTCNISTKLREISMKRFKIFNFTLTVKKLLR